MSRGMPSMTALSGTARDCGIPESGQASRDAQRRHGPEMQRPPAVPTSPGLGGLMGNLGGVIGWRAALAACSTAGIGELFEKFKQNGHGDTAQSWVNDGPNKEVSPPQLKQAIGADVLAALEQQTGLSQEELLARLARELPAAVDNTRRAAVCPPLDRKAISSCTLEKGGITRWAFIWTIIIGFVAGVIAKFIMPGDKNEPSGFILTVGAGNRRRLRGDLSGTSSRLV